ncbi:MAG: response regulator transcription factor [Dehalococcoidia bacterium]
MTSIKGPGKILIVDDEWESPIVKAVQRRLETEGWHAITVVPESPWRLGEEFETAALYAIEEQRPDGILLDVRLGEHRDEQFKGLEILQRIVERHPQLPVLMFTQYAQGPDRETAVRGSLKWNAPVDFIDKLASPEEVVLRLRRLIGTTPETIAIGSHLLLDVGAGVVSVRSGDALLPVADIQGMKFEIFRELASAWYRSPGELVAFSRLERYSEGEEARASLRVRIREIKVSIGKTLGRHLGANDLIINVRDRGYRLVPP